MAMLTQIDILIALVDAVEPPGAPSIPPRMPQTICLYQLPAPGAPTFILDFPHGGQRRQTQLSAAQSQELWSRVQDLPTQSLTYDVTSLDGRWYIVTVQHTTKQVVFEWNNDDWRNAPADQVEAWRQIAALADYVLELAAEASRFGCRVPATSHAE
jgi:hypothetical protein